LDAEQKGNSYALFRRKNGYVYGLVGETYNSRRL
jgi:hypothetical protein